MLNFTCYRLHETLLGRVPDDLDEYIDMEEHTTIVVYGPVRHDGFEAKLYVSTGLPRPPLWAGFVHEGFDEVARSTFRLAQEVNDPLLLPVTSSTGVAVIVKLTPEQHAFAFTFGVAGRHLLKHEAWKRNYGLQTALNLIYPRVAGIGSAGRLVAVDAKRRAGEVIRSRQQASKATTFETFDVDKVRDLVGGATGEPYDRKWGKRISGTDQLSFTADVDFSSLGKLCRELDEAHGRDDYKDRFSWLDSIRPIHDPSVLSELQEYVVGELLTGPLGDLDLAPPEVIDWSQVAGFRYHYERRQSFTRPEMQLAVYRNNLLHHESDPDSIDVEYLRRKSIFAVDADGNVAYKWPVWRCIAGEFRFKGNTYVIDEGEIFEVSSDYLEELNQNLSKLPMRDDLPWPKASHNTSEDSFNRAAADTLSPALLMDKQLVNSRMQTTPVEVCDVLTGSCQLIHAKLKFGSRDLSHLFSQGFVSATLLQSDSVFREATHEKIMALTGGANFYFFDAASINASDFEVIYVIVAPWYGRNPTEALPFFSKINLLRTAEELINRGFRVALARVDTSSK